MDLVQALGRPSPTICWLPAPHDVEMTPEGDLLTDSAGRDDADNPLIGLIMLVSLQLRTCSWVGPNAFSIQLHYDGRESKATKKSTPHGSLAPSSCVAHELAQQLLVLLLYEATLDAQARVGEVLAHVVVHLLGPHAAFALLEETLNAFSPSLR